MIMLVQTGVDNIKSRVWTKLHHGECIGNWWEDRVAKKCGDDQEYKQNVKSDNQILCMARQPGKIKKIRKKQRMLDA